MEIFAKAARQKLRFPMRKGEGSIEDLWDLSLPALDTLAKGVNKQIKEEDEESFIRKKSKASTELHLKLEILKFVISTKIEEDDKRKQRAERLQRLEQLKELARQKEGEKLAEKSLEDVHKEIRELESAV